jgi:hypothetical protein
MTDDTPAGRLTERLDSDGSDLSLLLEQDITDLRAVLDENEAMRTRIDNANREIRRQSAAPGTWPIANALAAVETHLAGVGAERAPDPLEASDSWSRAQAHDEQAAQQVEADLRAARDMFRRPESLLEAARRELLIGPHCAPDQDVPTHLGPGATCFDPACVKAREQHEAAADIQHLTAELFADKEPATDERLRVRVTQGILREDAPRDAYWCTSPNHARREHHPTITLYGGPWCLKDGEYEIVTEEGDPGR